MTLTLARWPSYELQPYPPEMPHVQLWTSYVKAFESYCITGRECVQLYSYASSHPVTWQRWRLHHSIRRTRKPHAARKRHGSVFDIERELLPIEVLHCGNRNFRPFGSCDLDIDPITFIYELDPKTVDRTPHVRIWTSTLRLSKVIVWQTYRHTHRQTYRDDQN